MNDQELKRIDDFIARVRAFRITAAVGPATGWDADAVEIEEWHAKYHQLHVPRFFRAYTVDRDELIAALDGHVVDETTARRAMRELMQHQFRGWLQSENVDAGDLDGMVAAYDVNPLAGLPEVDDRRG
jgi:hypothetical protein